MSVPTILHAESFAWSGNPYVDALGSGIYTWFSQNVGGRADWTLTAGRGGGAALVAIGGDNTNDATGAILGWDPASPRTVIGNGMAYSQGVFGAGTSIGVYFGNSLLMNYWDSNPHYNVGANKLVQIGTDAAGHLQVRQGNNQWPTAPILGTSSYVMPPGRQSGPQPYVWLEWLVTFNVTTGSVVIKADGATVLTVTGVNTGAAMGHARLHANDGRFAADWVIHDGSDYLGDSRVAFFPAQSNGTYTAGTPAGSTSPATNLIAVADVPPFDTAPHTRSDFDSSYIAFNDTGLPKAATFNTWDLPTNATSVTAVIPQATVRKDDASTNSGRLIFISGATETDGGSDIPLVNAWLVPRRVYMTDPNTSAAWTLVNANLVEVGWRRTA